MHVIVKAVVAAQSDPSPEAEAVGEKDLRCCVIPDLKTMQNFQAAISVTRRAYLRVEQFGGVGGEVIENAVPGAIQRNASN